jgi:anti-sigma B factor antagonist
MGVSVRNKGKVSIVDVKGKLTIGAEVALRTEISALLERGARLFVFNLCGVPFIDSIGLGETVACTKRICDREGSVKVVLPERSKVREVLNITGLNRAYEIFDDEEEALASWIP